MKLKGPLLAMLLLLSFLSEIPIPLVHAQTINHGPVQGTAAAATVSISQAQTSGDTLLVLCVAFNIQGSALLFTASDADGDVFTQKGSQSVTLSGTHVYGVVGFTATATTTATKQNNCNYTGGGTIGSNNIFLYDLGPSGLAVTQTASGSCNAGCSKTLQTGSITIDSGGLAIGAFVASPVDVGGNSLGSMLSAFPNGGTPCGGANECTLYSSSLGGAATTFAFTNGASSFTVWAELGFDLNVNAPVATTIGPCNFFQLQCWWYPLLFMGLYSGFMLMVGTWLRTSPRGKTHIFLSAVTFGSLIAVIFGIMNIVFPLMMLVLNTIIALRLRG